MYLISAEGYKNAKVNFERVRKKGEIWASMKNVRSGTGVKNISNLVLKEIHGILKTKTLTKEQIKKYKTTEREIFEEFDNLSEEKFDTQSNKNVYVKNVVMTAIIKCCRGEKKGCKSNRRIKKKINDFRFCNS